MPLPGFAVAFDVLAAAAAFCIFLFYFLSITQCMQFTIYQVGVRMCACVCVCVCAGQHVSYHNLCCNRKKGHKWQR